MDSAKLIPSVQFFVVYPTSHPCKQSPFLENLLHEEFTQCSEHG